jgi:hypothetical protein
LNVRAFRGDVRIYPELAEGFANWAHQQLIEVLDSDPPAGLNDWHERYRRAIYDFVMGQVHGVEWKDMV